VQQGLYEQISSLQGTPFPLLYQYTSEPGLAALHPGQGRQQTIVKDKIKCEILMHALGLHC